MRTIFLVPPAFVQVPPTLPSHDPREGWTLTIPAPKENKVGGAIAQSFISKETGVGAVGENKAIGKGEHRHLE